MQSPFYVSLSAQVALDKRLSTIAANVANAATVGYRASGVTFETAMSNAASTPTAYVAPGDDHILRTQGALAKTDNPLDVAVVGDGWLAVRAPTGVVYTRDGRLLMNEAGELTTLQGHPVLDAGNSPITLDPTAGPPTIFRDGMINQGASQVGALGLFAIPEDATLTRAENAGVTPNKPATPILDFVRNGVTQGFVENANVNPLHEMTKLIMTTRSFENVSAMYDTLDTAQRDAIRIIGGA